MPKKLHLPNLSLLLRERLTALGASQLPTTAMAQLERDVLLACGRAVARAVTAPRIGRAVSVALAASADTQGLKGGTPLTSSCEARNAQNSVAGPTYNSADIKDTNGDAGVSDQPTGGVT
jgi:hypothetical protein